MQAGKDWAVSKSGGFFCWLFFFLINLNLSLCPAWTYVLWDRTEGVGSLVLPRRSICSLLWWRPVLLSGNGEKPRMSVEFMHNCAGQVQVRPEGHRDLCGMSPLRAGAPAGSSWYPGHCESVPQSRSLIGKFQIKVNSTRLFTCILGIDFYFV